MKLVHYSAAPLGALCPAEQRWRSFKPHGLWVSDDDCAANWRAWCEAEGFRLDCLAHATEVTLADGAEVLLLEDDDAVARFHTEWQIADFDGDLAISARYRLVDWRAVAARHAGFVVTPYRKHPLELYPVWYDALDCAGGCIWDPAAIASLRPLAG